MRTFASYFLLLALLVPALTFGQGDQVATPIQLRNPSFEDMPRNSMPPIGWTDCGWATETAPDVQPDPMNQFRVTKTAQDGNTYLGMVVRDNDTWERVGQELNEPMLGGQCYAFRIHLARSQSYVSQSRVSDKPANYVTPTKLRVWGGYDLCDRVNIIGETDLVKNFDWKEYKLKLKPEEGFTHLIFEVFYQTPNLIPYNGNLLLDNASAMMPMACEDTIPDVPGPIITDPTNEPSVVIVDVPKPRDTEPRVTPKSVEPTEPPAPVKYKLGKTEAALEINTIFQIEAITFKANSWEIEHSSRAALEEIIEFMNANPGVEIEIGGHASSQAGDKYALDISLDRAKSVVSYLRKAGIKMNRLTPFGYGKSRRLCIDDTDACRRRNQRVEVKIKKVDETKSTE